MKTYGTLSYHPRQPRGLWQINADPHVMIRVKRIFGWVRRNRVGAVLIADIPEIARDLEWLLDRHSLRLDDATQAHLAGQADRFRSQEQAALYILGGQQPPLALPEPGGPARSGAVVIAADGTASVVTGICPQGEVDCYEVMFGGGAVVECSAVHLGHVRHCRGRTRSKTTGKMNPPYWQVTTLRDLRSSPWAASSRAVSSATRSRNCRLRSSAASSRLRSDSSLAGCRLVHGDAESASSSTRPTGVTASPMSRPPRARLRSRRSLISPNKRQRRQPHA